MKPAKKSLLNRMRRTMMAGAVLGLAATGTSAEADSRPAAKPPNVIFILADDLGFGDVGVFFQNARRASGNRASLLTPQIDRCAAEGARLTHHYSAAPVCAPSRASLLSGVHQGHANVRNNQFDKALADNHTLATVLRQAGYATAAIGKWGLQGYVEGATPNWPAHPQNRGFDFFFGYIRHVDGHEHYPKEAPYRNRGNTPPKQRSAANGQAEDANPLLHGKEVWENRRELSTDLDKCYTTDLFTARAKDWIIRHRASHPDQPFFTYLAFDTPHAVLELPTVAYPDGGGLNGGMQWLGAPGHMINTAEGTIDSWTHPDFARATFDDDGNPVTPEKPWADVYRRFATSVRRIDDAVGDLTHLLRDLGIDQNTLIVVTSDNGPEKESFLKEAFSPEFFASYGPFDGIKRDLWEGGMRVPTVVCWPGKIPANREVVAPSANWDWLPTLAELAGLPPPARADGTSLLPALLGRDDGRARKPLYFEYTVGGRTPDYAAFESGRRNRLRGEMQAIRLGDFMGVRYDIKSAKDDFEIYDVTRDPKEAKNRAAEPAFVALQQEMKDRVLQARRPDAAAARPYDREMVPANRVDAGKLAAGVLWRSVEGAFPWVPDFSGLAPAAQGQARQLDVGSVSEERKNFAAIFNGYLVVPADGDYTFALRTDTGAVLRVHDATLIDADFGYATGTERAATIKLATGLHAFSLSYLHRDGVGRLLDLKWGGPGIERQAIPPSAFRHGPRGID